MQHPKGRNISNPAYTRLCLTCATLRGMDTKMDAGSTPEDRNRAEKAAARIARIGIPKQELALKAGIDRGTLGRALKADPRIAERTWVKIERVLTNLEVDLGIDVRVAGQQSGMTASGETVVVELDRGDVHMKITTSGDRAEVIAEAIRQAFQSAD